MAKRKFRDKWKHSLARSLPRTPHFVEQQQKCLCILRLCHARHLSNAERRTRNAEIFFINHFFFFLMAFFLRARLTLASFTIASCHCHRQQPTTKRNLLCKINKVWKIVNERTAAEMKCAIYSMHVVRVFVGCLLSHSFVCVSSVFFKLRLTWMCIWDIEETALEKTTFSIIQIDTCFVGWMLSTISGCCFASINFDESLPNISIGQDIGDFHFEISISLVGRHRPNRFSVRLTTSKCTKLIAV